MKRLATLILLGAAVLAGCAGQSGEALDSDGIKIEVTTTTTSLADALAPGLLGPESSVKNTAHAKCITTALVGLVGGTDQASLASRWDALPPSERDYVRTAAWERCPASNF